MAQRPDQDTPDRTPDQTPQPQPAKDPDDWVTGDEPMTGPQASYLSTLAHEAGEEVDDDLTKAEASKRIDELQSAPAAAHKRRKRWKTPWPFSCA